MGVTDKNMSLQEVFASAGKSHGLEIWRVENFELKAIPKNTYGQFFRGDSYLILWTETGSGGVGFQNLHYWIGSESTQDEYGAAAAISAQMDAALNDNPIQFREVEGMESKQFLWYFDDGIQYREGGVKSGFNHVEVNEDNNRRLLRVKGRPPYVFSYEVSMSWDNFTTDDAYICEIGSQIYVWRGKSANEHEGLKAAAVAQNILDKEQCGRGDIHNVEEEQENYPEEMIAELGPKPDSFKKSSQADIGKTEQHRAIVTKSDECVPSLYKCSKDTGSLEVSEIAKGRDLDRKLLETDDSFILDCSSCGVVYVWNGKTALPSERSAAMKKAEELLTKNGLAMCAIQCMAQAAEVDDFKTFFNWLA